MTQPLDRRDALLSLAKLAAGGVAATSLAACVTADSGSTSDRNLDGGETYSEEEIVRATADFFGATAEVMSQVVARVFSDLGRPNGYVAGEELAGAVGVGLRYGNGWMTLKSGARRKVYWQGPSLGFDTGGNASKVFTLVYNLRQADDIYRRFPGVEGTAYFIGGVGVNYQRADGITLAPMRAGVGLRAGANIGYLAYSRRQRVLPF
jgi:hypothetical protein